MGNPPQSEQTLSVLLSTSAEHQLAASTLADTYLVQGDLHLDLSNACEADVATKKRHEDTALGAFLQAEAVLEQRLHERGWLGFTELHSNQRPSVLANIYVPESRQLIKVKVRLAERLNDLGRLDEALAKAEQGLRTIVYTVHPLQALKASLLFFAGRIRRQLFSAAKLKEPEEGEAVVVHAAKVAACSGRWIFPLAVVPGPEFTPPPGDEDEEDEDAASAQVSELPRAVAIERGIYGTFQSVHLKGTSAYEQFVRTAIAALEESIAITVHQGGHNYSLIVSCCMELALFFGAGPVQDLRDRHLLLCGYYLRTASGVLNMYTCLRRDVHDLGKDTLNDEQLKAMPVSVKRDIEANYKDADAKMCFRNILYRMVALRRDQHLNTALNDRRVAIITDLHSFLQQQCEPYRTQCTVQHLPQCPFPGDPDFEQVAAVDSGASKVPPSLVSGQWYCSTNDEDRVELLYLLGAPSAEHEGKRGKGKDKDAGKKAADAPLEQATLLLEQFHGSYNTVYDLQQRIRAVRIGLDTTPREESEAAFNRCVADVRDMLVPRYADADADADAKQDEADNADENAGEADTADDTSASSGSQLLLPTNNKQCQRLLKDLDDLFNVSTGIDAQSSELCAWLRKLLSDDP